MFKLILIIFSLFILPQSVTAAQSTVRVETTGDNVQVNVDSQTSSSNRTVINSNDSSTISVSQSGGSDNSVKINNNRFEITGTVTSIGNNSFALSNQTIYMDSSAISGLKSNGVLIMGNVVTAEGSVKEGKLYAEKVTGSSKSGPESTTVPSSPPQSVSPSPEASPSPSPEVLGAVEFNTEFNAEPPSFFTKVIDFCKGIISVFKFGF